MLSELNVVDRNSGKTKKKEQEKQECRETSHCLSFVRVHCHEKQGRGLVLRIHLPVIFPELITILTKDAYLEFSNFDFSSDNSSHMFLF